MCINNNWYSETFSIVDSNKRKEKRWVLNKYYTRFFSNKYINSSDCGYKIPSKSVHSYIKLKQPGTQGSANGMVPPLIFPGYPNPLRRIFIIQFNLDQGKHLLNTQGNI